MKDRLLWDKIITDSTRIHLLYELLPPPKSRSLARKGHPYILPRVRTERRHEHCFLN